MYDAVEIIEAPNLWQIKNFESKRTILASFEPFFDHVKEDFGLFMHAVDVQVGPKLRHVECGVSPVATDVGDG